MSVTVPLGAVGEIVVFPEHAHMLFYSCVALSQQLRSHYFFYLIYAFFLKLSKNGC